jgi:hypothetical protein
MIVVSKLVGRCGDCHKSRNPARVARMQFQAGLIALVVSAL